MTSLLVNLGLCVLSLSAALGIGEVTVRWLAPQQLILKRPDIWVAADTLGWTQRPDLSTTINTGERTVHLFTDADGFRVGRAGRVEGR
ncbi:MAG: hypothetical protein ACREL2_01155, partial [Gemmatimonadales bacterium]